MMKYFKFYLKYLVSIICQYNLPIMKELLYLKDDQLKATNRKTFYKL